MDPSTAPVPHEALLRHEAFLRGLARALVGDRSEAEDLVQETWLAALRRRPDSSESLRPWLARSLRGLVATRRRSFARRAGTERRAARAEALADEIAPAELIERQQVVVRAVLGLEEPYRETVLLRYGRELSLKQVARAQDVPLETVRTRLKRGLAQLRERLDREHGGDREAWAAVLRPALVPPRSVPLGPLLLALAVGTASIAALLLARAAGDGDRDPWGLERAARAGSVVLRDHGVEAELSLAAFEMVADTGSEPIRPPIELALRVEVDLRVREEALPRAAEAPAELGLTYERLRARTEVAALLDVDPEPREQRVTIDARSALEGRAARVPASDAPLAALLPAEPFEVGAQWTAPVGVLVRLLAPDGPLELAPEPSEPPLVLGAGFWSPADWLGEDASGELRVRLVEAGDADAGLPAVLALEATVEDERDLLARGRPRELGPGVRREDLRARTQVTGTGELFWDLRRGRARALTFEGALEVTLDETRAFETPAGAYRLHSDARLSGSLRARVELHDPQDDSTGEKR